MPLSSPEIRNRSWWLVLLVILIIGVITLLAIGMLQTASPSSPFRRVAVQVAPAVVNIAADKVVRVPRMRASELDNLLPREPEAHPPRRHQHILGTGFIFDARGYVLTNYHIISGYDDIVITLADGTEFTADSIRRVGVDPWSDLAVLKIETGRRLPVARLGNSDLLQLGDWVAAVGNPFGLSGTITAGIVSAVNRSGIPIRQGPRFQDFIQTDAAINPGNSGGPLVNEAGEVVGVNTAISSPVRGNVGIGFAIPISFARAVAEELILKGYVTRGFLGIRTQSIDDRIQQALGLKSRNGVLVTSVDSNGPAARTGLKPGDVIIRFDDEEVVDLSHFQALAAGSEPGSNVRLELRRWGKPLIVTLTVEKQTEPEPKPLPPPATRFWLGISVRDLLPEEKTRLGNIQGVVVNLVEIGGPGESAGIRVRDIIQGIDDYPVTNREDYRRLGEMMKRSTKPLLLRILRGNQPMYIAVQPQ